MRFTAAGRYLALTMGALTAGAGVALMAAAITSASGGD
jgi:hypothetical protein